MNSEAPLDPGGLMHWLAALPEKTEMCVECGAGTGELSAFLATHFTKSLATDLNPPKADRQQIRVTRSSAERLPLQSQSVDLLFSMQALHHFNQERHLIEAERVLRSGGVFAALCWGEMLLPAAVAQAYQPVFDCIDPFWEPTRDWVLSGYDGLAFAGAPIDVPKAFMRRRVTLDQLEAEMAKWSAVQAALAAGAEFPELAPSPDLPDDIQTFEISWPILGRVFRRS